MDYNKHESMSADLVALETLKRRLQRRYAEAETAQTTTGKRPSGRMRGLEEAIRETDSMIQERAGEGFAAYPMQMSILESQTDIGCGVTLQSWFTRAGANHVRSEVYVFEDGSVVAYQDCVNGVNYPLRMENMFQALYEGEPAYWLILQYAGIMDPSKVQLYYLGR